MHKSRTIIIHYGEIGLKGKNQVDFLRQLQDNLTTVATAIHGELSVVARRGYYAIDLADLPDDATARLTAALSLTPGISWFAVAEELDIPHDVYHDTHRAQEIYTDAVIATAKECFTPQATFAMRVKRRDKSLPFTSGELEKQLGAAIVAQTQWDAVDLTTPDQIFYLDISREHTFLYTKKHLGAGGLPVGSTGRVLSLLSGGIDSPVASYLMARRGCHVDFIHFTATPLQQREAMQYKVSQLAQKLSQTTLTSTLYLIPYTQYQLATLEKRISHDLVMFRRFMIRIAERLAEQHGHEALVTGDNLSQVASQTLPNLVSTSQAVTLPILRPLLGYDKNEIIALAEKIDTYDLSIEPYKDCCSIISQNPRTRSRHEQLEAIENKVFEDYEKLIDQTLEEMTVLHYENGHILDKDQKN